MAEGHALGNPILIRGMDHARATQVTTALGILGLTQVPPAGARAQHFAAGRDLKPLGHGLLGLDAFWTSHKSIRFRLKEGAI